MAKTIGGIWVVYDDLQTERIERRLMSGSGTINLFSGSSCLALLSATDSTIDYLAIATAGKKAGDMERKVVFGPALPFKNCAKPETGLFEFPIINSVETKKVLSELSPKHSRYIIPPNRRVTSIPPASWEAFLHLVCKHGEVSKDQVQYLKDLIISRKRDKIGSLPDIVQHERDAVAISLDVFGGSSYRQKYLSAAPATEDAPFIRALEKSDVNVLEDRMIEHDIANFPGANAISRHLVGAVKIETDIGTLTIVNANRSNIEHTLGVDLVYYNHKFASFVLVQYKRLTGSENPVYHPNSDSCYKSELQRMKNFQKNCISTKKNCDYIHYRLQDNPFYFKLCNSQQQSQWSARMLSGMYFPLDLWERFILSDAAKGPRGGISIGWENADRRLTNTEFSRLVKGGWVGSSGEQSEHLNEILTAELAEGKSIIAAIQSTEQSSENLLRDVHGRFASIDDPDSL
jgi:hypothetical protein